VRTVGELIANQFSVGLSRMARLVKERMSINTDPEKINIDDLVNARTVSAVIQAFFGSSQLSQFMDQTNPLAEMTHKRRMSGARAGRPDPRARRLRGARRALLALRAHVPDRDARGSEHRADHVAHHLRPDQRARLRRDAVPGREGRQGHDEIEWLSANEEEEARIAQANAPLSEDGKFVNEFVLCRERGDFPLLGPRTSTTWTSRRTSWSRWPPR
jgi:DNA-directed RNA polymerase subunit beta